MEGRPPGFLATRSVASDLHVTVASRLSGGTVAWFPGDRYRAWLPGMMEAALGRPGCTGHLVSRTYFRLPGLPLTLKRQHLGRVGPRLL